jgi:hypothetical protein
VPYITLTVATTVQSYVSEDISFCDTQHIDCPALFIQHFEVFLLHNEYYLSVPAFL